MSLEHLQTISKHIRLTLLPTLLFCF